MNNLEQQLIYIDEWMADAIQKQKLSVAETIHKVAEYSINACRTLDDEFRDIFPELAELEHTKGSDTPPQPFNPEYVIEIKDGKGNKFIDTWDNSVGLLPNRKVMGKYYIDVGQDNPFLYDMTNNTYAVKDVSGGVVRKINCDYIKRNEHRILFNTCFTYPFEIDNYLNLYYPNTGLYLIFNKTIFPAFPFLTRPNIFQSKRITSPDLTMKFKLDPKWYSSVDARPDILAAVPELIPDDYYKVIDFYDRFRQMTSYKRGLRQLGAQNSLFVSETQEIDSEELPPSGHELITTDTRDKLIRELESRLSGCLKQIELTDEYNRELVDLFTKQSAEVLDLTRRLNQYTADKQTTETAKRLAENHEIFALKKQLADAQSYIARCQMLGGDITRLETELTNSQLLTQKYKDLAQGLTDQLLSVKRELRDKSVEHAAGIKTATRDMSRIAGLEKDNSRLTQDNLALQTKCRNLEAQILGGNINSKPEKEALEQVLITKCDELTRDRDELAQKYTELVRANKQLERDYEEFRGSITRLMTGR